MPDWVTNLLRCLHLAAQRVGAGPLPWDGGRWNDRSVPPVVLSHELWRRWMLAPPNRGSEIVDWSRRHRIVHRLIGPAGRELGSDGVPVKLPGIPENSEIAVIMGNRCSIPLFRKLLENDNDGIVSAARGEVPGLRGFRVVDADHTFIQMHPEAIQLSVEFLKTGSWANDRF